VRFVGVITSLVSAGLNCRPTFMEASSTFF